MKTILFLFASAFLFTSCSRINPVKGKILAGSDTLSVQDKALREKQKGDVLFLKREKDSDGYWQLCEDEDPLFQRDTTIFTPANLLSVTLFDTTMEYRKGKAISIEKHSFFGWFFGLLPWWAWVLIFGLLALFGIAAENGGGGSGFPNAGGGDGFSGRQDYSIFSHEH